MIKNVCQKCSGPIKLTPNHDVPSVAKYSKAKKYIGHFWPSQREGNLCYYHQLIKDLKQ